MTKRADRFADLELETMLLGRHLAPQRRSRAEERRLERSGYTLLSQIQAHGPMSIGELSDALGLDVSTLNRQTAALTTSGYLERIPDPDGGVARKFRMTPSGHEQLDEHRRANVEGLGRILQDWPAEDVDRFVVLLRRFNSDIERLDGQPWPRA